MSIHAERTQEYYHHRDHHNYLTLNGVKLFIGSGLSQFGKKNISDFLEYLDQDTYRVLFDWFPMASFCMLGFKETGSSPGYWFRPRRWINSSNSWMKTSSMARYARASGAGCVGPHHPGEQKIFVLLENLISLTQRTNLAAGRRW